ncbi:PaaI family thioesterase [Roseimarinus sediminis]|jgi:uncharacterized protein (TIGR00369 family)|uniref:PaaI family thioesterase n=1 Tax=Roseimarinus sediminis TaxID=1610899 RepID=UPI003D1B8082
MRRIINPFADLWKEGYNCFGCSPKNDIGLQLEFFDDGEGLVAFWQPKELLQGYPDVVHGGIQSTLLDEIGGWTVYIKCQTAGVTTNMNISFHRPMRISSGKVRIVGRLKEQNEKTAVMYTALTDEKGEVVYTEGLITYFIYPQALAVSRMHYPGLAAFYEE